jgi:hypothetical protein
MSSKCRGYRYNATGDDFSQAYIVQAHAGHKTIAIHRSDTAVKAMPPWTDIEADVDVVCKLHQCVNDVFPVGEIDCVVVGIFHQVTSECKSHPISNAQNPALTFHHKSRGYRVRKKLYTELLHVGNISKNMYPRFCPCALPRSTAAYSLFSTVQVQNMMQETRFTR